MNDNWEFYIDAEIQWRWRQTDSEGNIIGESAEGYANKPACFGNARCNGWKETKVNFSDDAVRSR